MRIYIDEGGTFQVPIGKDHLFSIVAALIIPACKETDLFYQFLRLRDAWGNQAIEIKGRELGETQIAHVIDLLISFDVLFEFQLIDMGGHTTPQLEEFRAAQAKTVADSVTADHQPTMIDEMKQLSHAILDTPLQLFVQAFLTIKLIGRVFETATMYYCQRLPDELGRFDWVIDRKDRDVTPMEKLWTSLIVPVGIATSLKKPFTRLKGGDYSHMERFRANTGDSKMRRLSNGWTRTSTSTRRKFPAFST